MTILSNLCAAICFNKCVSEKALLNFCKDYNVTEDSLSSFYIKNRIEGITDAIIGFRDERNPMFIELTRGV